MNQENFQIQNPEVKDAENIASDLFRIGACTFDSKKRIFESKVKAVADFQTLCFALLLTTKFISIPPPPKQYPFPPQNRIIKSSKLAQAFCMQDCSLDCSGPKIKVRDSQTKYTRILLVE